MKDRDHKFDPQMFTVLRALRGLTPEEAARKAGISASTVRNWRKGPRYGGTRFPQYWTIQKAMKAIGYVPRWLNEADGTFADQRKDERLFDGKPKATKPHRKAGRRAPARSKPGRQPTHSGTAALQ